MAKVYNDEVFGGASWSKDHTQIVLVGEKPEPTYKSYWEDSKATPTEESKEEKPPTKDEKWQDEKFMFVEDFGEMLVGKKRPGMFVFNLIENTLKEVVGLEKYMCPASPIFDHTSKGIVMSTFSEFP